MNTEMERELNWDDEIEKDGNEFVSVSYTHLTLPTIA